jgi:hypothetical protein
VRLDPLINFETETFNLPFYPLETFAVCWRGYFRATQAGHYAFIVGSDDGALLEIDNAAVCGQNRLQGYYESRGELDLAQGLHVLRLRFFQNRGPCACKLFFVSPSGGDPVIVPTELLYPSGSSVEAARPQVTGVSPAQGAKRGDTITITGANFADTPALDKVTFGPESVPAVVTQASATALEVVVPGGVDQGPISVTVGDQTAPGVPYQVGGFFGLLGRVWRDTSGNAVSTYADPQSPTLPDDERLWGPLDIGSMGAFQLAFPAVAFRACYTGRFYAIQGGEHGFSLDSDDGSRLLVDGQPLLDDSGLHPRKHVQGTLFLAQGWHDVEVDFYQNQGDASLTLGHADPGGSISVCPRALLAPPEVYDAATQPLVSSVAPATANVGDQLAIQGQGFVSPDNSRTRVFLGSVELPVLSIQPSSVLTQVIPGADSGPIVVRAGPLESPPSNVVVQGYGLKGEYWNMGGPLSSLPALNKPADVTRTDPVIDFQEDSAFQIPWQDYFAARWTGDLVIPADGSYEIAIGSDDGGRVLLDGRVVVDNDGLHGYTEVGQTLSLTAGNHALTVLFFENDGAARCRFLWRPPGTGGRVVVPRVNLLPAS